MAVDVFVKAVLDRLRLVAIVSASLAALNVLVLLLFGSLGEEYGELMEAFPPEIMEALGAGDLGTPEGWLNAEMFSLVIPIALVAVGVVVGVAAIAGEEDRGTLNVLLATPVTRTGVAIGKALALAVLLVAISALSYASLVLGAALGNVDIGADQLLDGTVMSLLFGLLFSYLAFGVGAATGRTGLAAALGAGLAVVAFVMNAFLPLVESWEWAQELSPFYWYLGTEPLSDGMDPVSVVLFVGFSVLFIAWGVLAFDRRDIGV